MKNYALAAIALVAGMVIVSCGNSGYKKTETGLAYSIVDEGKGEKLKHGELIKINLKLMNRHLLVNH